MRNGGWPAGDDRWVPSWGMLVALQHGVHWPRVLCAAALVQRQIHRSGLTCLCGRGLLLLSTPGASRFWQAASPLHQNWGSVRGLIGLISSLQLVPGDPVHSRQPPLALWGLGMLLRHPTTL